MKKIRIAIASILAAGMIAAPALVFAETKASTSTPATMSAEKMASAKARADKEIDRRIAALNDVNTRVQAMQKVTDTFKQGLATNVQTQIAAFTALKAKIDADTDAATLKADIESITQSYRVYALILPQVRIAAAADRVVLTTSMMTTLGSKLQARISSAQSSGADVTKLNAALSDLAAKISDASSQAQSAVSTTAGLTPDNGDKTKMAANDAAFKAARASLQTAQKDIVAARKDIEAILKGLKVAAKNSGTATTSAETH